MNRLKPHLALLTCNVVWALDYPFYNIVLPYYVHPMAMISASLIATALLSLIPLLWEQGVTGSNPVTPTFENQSFSKYKRLICFLYLHTIYTQLSGFCE